MKRIILILLPVLMVLALCACGGETDKQTGQTAGEGQTDAPVSVIYAPRAWAEYQWMDKAEAERELREAGFSVFESEAIEDICTRSPIADGAVAAVEINGQTRFEASAAFPEDASVKIIFHSIPRLQVPVSGEKARSMEYLEAGEKYSEAGFTNIQTGEAYDLNPGATPVTEVLLDGKEISGEETIPFDGEISIIGHFPRSLYAVKVNVEFIGNLLFSKYDVDVCLDDQDLGCLDHGEDGCFELDLEEGRHNLLFSNAENSGVCGEAALNITSDTELEYTIFAHSDQVSVNLESKTEALQSGEVKLPFSYRHYLRMDGEQAAAELKALGFANITLYESTDSLWKHTPAGSVIGLTVDGKSDFAHDDIVKTEAEVQVFCHICDFAFTETEIIVTEKESFEIPYTLTSGDLLETVRFEVQDEDLVRQNDHGVFEALAPGHTQIRAVCGGKVCSQCDVTVEEILIPVERLTLSAQKLDVAAGSYFDVTYICEPQDANYREILVTMTGVPVEDCGNGRYYSAVSGDTELTFSQDDRILAICRIHSETVNITALTLGEAPRDLVIGQTAELPFCLEPENATCQGITAASSDPRIAAVIFDERGDPLVQVTGVAAGKADVILTVPDGTQYKQTVEVREILPIQLDAVLKSPEIPLYVGDPVELELQWTPADTSIQEVQWTSGNSSVIRIGQDGKMEAVGVGKTTLTARHKSGVTGKIELEVLPTPVEKIEISTDYQDERFVKGNQMTLSAVVFPQNATDKTVTWSSSDTAVLTVDQRGVVTAVGEGSAEITAESPNGIKAVYPVQVQPAPQRYTVSWSLTQVSNDHVGSNWTRGCEINGEVCNSGSSLMLDPDAEISVNLWVQDNDSNPDYDAYYQDIRLTEDIRKNGFIQEGELQVCENGGRYSGNISVWQFRFTLTPSRW